MSSNPERTEQGEMRAIHNFLKIYFRDHGDDTVSVQDVLDVFKRQFDQPVLEPGWLEEVLKYYIEDKMVHEHFRIVHLLRSMKDQDSALYDPPITKALSKIHTLALRRPWDDWKRYCKFIGLLTHDDCEFAGHGTCAAGPVFAILLDTFNDRADPEFREELLAGASACVCQLGRHVVDKIASKSWSLDEFWGHGEDRVVSQEEWLGWRDRFREISDDGSQSTKLKKQASKAAMAMDTSGSCSFVERMLMLGWPF
ncbi:hypothetical protein F5Y03DRAFT_399877 [Xylaria venustula]|nr:hypothetical protein F5Y03DRAFT_399877 [Xylaria venustula]